MKTQVEPFHYFNETYDTKEYFISYWHQINEVVKLNPKKILEIGVGNRFLSTYLTKMNIDITTMDFDRQLTPNVVGNIINIPFRSKSFDVVACYEVLEHLPFSYFSNALLEIFRITDSSAVLSLPDVNPKIRLFLQIPMVRIIRKLISLPSIKKPHVFNGEHYWEIGKAGYSLRSISSAIEKAGFEIERTYRIFENPYHRFFILNKL